MFGFIKDVADIVTAPIKIASSVAGSVTRPVAEACNEIVDEVDEFLEE